jgi:hypothetical protein
VIGKGMLGVCSRGNNLRTWAEFCSLEDGIVRERNKDKKKESDHNIENVIWLISSGVEGYF